VANLRLQVDEPADHAKYSATDPGASGSPQGYAAHYCNIPTRVDPKLVACSFIASGLRLFDISKLDAPREVGYFVAPTQARSENQGQASDFAMSMPAFVPERREIWFTDGTSGFYALRVSPDVWPAAASPSKGALVCSSRRAFAVRVRLPRGARVRSASATLAGKRVRGLARRGRYERMTVDLRGLRRQVATLVVRVRLRGGRTVTARRVYHPCTRRA